MSESNRALRIAPLDLGSEDTARGAQELWALAAAQEALWLGLPGPAALPGGAHSLQIDGQSVLGLWSDAPTPDLRALLAVTDDDEPDMRCISVLVVHPNQQRRGLARQLLLHLFALHPSQTFTVLCASANAAAQALYRGMGFEPYRRGSLGAQALPVIKFLRRPLQPQTLGPEGIAAHIPHSGSMCLLQGMRAWSATHIECTARSHLEADNPLRSDGALLSPNAIEYAAQAMALHGNLSAGAGSAPTSGFLASVRGVRLGVQRLDEVEGELIVTARKLAGDARQAQYAFELHSAAGALLVDGRATVILNALP